tara:strand:- start:450 stop:563 length:114 start_codon:yes stop_codon:yes gene_type:complete
VDGQVEIEFDAGDNGYYCRNCDQVTEMEEKPETTLEK